VLNVILVKALSLHPIGGVGETKEWISLLVTLWGLPLSLLGEAVMPKSSYGVVASIMVLNCAAWGAVCCLLFHALRNRPRTRGTVGSSNASSHRVTSSG
jgi:hypothetical protein